MDKNSLRVLAQENNLLIGTAISAPAFLHEEQYRNTVKREFNLITLENELKFINVHPQREKYDFLLPDLMVEFAIKNKQKVRGHTLVWYPYLPDWIRNNYFSKEQLKKILKNHIHTVVGHYKGKIYAWDVVNEAFNDDGTLRDSIWLRGIGPEYIELAFRWAHEADPDALLFYNDFQNEGLNPKSQAIYETFRRLKEQGVPIDGIGLQMHTSINQPENYKDIYENLKRLTNLGLQVQFTEMDVKVQGNNESLKKRLEKQAEIYADTLKVCLSFSKCSAFGMWGFTDKYSWIPTYTGKDDKPLIFDNEYRPKPAYKDLYEVLLEKSKGK